MENVGTDGVKKDQGLEDLVLRLLVWLWRKNNRHVPVYARVPAHPAHATREVPHPTSS